ncbi:MAG TPA: threonine/serine dehydratase [Micromonosporaceae bacterium]|nr:threonine/serine dehydratase [Micromonosporaceae bacterium]
MLTRDDVDAAARRIAGRVRRTPVLPPDDGAAPVWFKCEWLQHTGSFKARGAFNRVLAAQQADELDPAVGVVAASGGNAGLAVAYAAAHVGVPAEIWVPTNAPPVKVARLRDLGATVVEHGVEYAEAYHGAITRADETGAVYCHAYDHVNMAAGAGTIGLELLEQVPGGFDTVIVAVGGGGLIAGVATSLEPVGVRVVGAEPGTAATLHTALAAGGPVDVPVSGIAADSLGARRVGEIAYAVATRTGVVSVLVDDADITAARRDLWHRHHIVVEHGAAAAWAALAAGAYRPEPDERIVVVLCGANTNPADLG